MNLQACTFICTAEQQPIKYPSCNWHFGLTWLANVDIEADRAGYMCALAWSAWNNTGIFSRNLIPRPFVLIAWEEKKGLVATVPWRHIPRFYWHTMFMWASVVGSLNKCPICLLDMAPKHSSALFSMTALREYLPGCLSRVLLVAIAEGDAIVRVQALPNGCWVGRKQAAEASWAGSRKLQKV